MVFQVGSQYYMYSYNESSQLLLVVSQLEKDCACGWKEREGESFDSKCQ